MGLPPRHFGGAGQLGSGSSGSRERPTDGSVASGGCDRRLRPTLAGRPEPLDDRHAGKGADGSGPGLPRRPNPLTPCLLACWSSSSRASQKWRQPHRAQPHHLLPHVARRTITSRRENRISVQIRALQGAKVRRETKTAPRKPGAGRLGIHPARRPPTPATPATRPARRPATPATLPAHRPATPATRPARRPATRRSTRQAAAASVRHPAPPGEATPPGREGPSGPCPWRCGAAPPPAPPAGAACGPRGWRPRSRTAPAR